MSTPADWKQVIDDSEAHIGPWLWHEFADLQTESACQKYARTMNAARDMAQRLLRIAEILGADLRHQVNRDPKQDWFTTIRDEAALELRRLLS